MGKASIGEAVREGNKFLHKASLLIPAEFAETKTAAARRRMWRTRQAHKAREAWLDEVMRTAGIEPLHGRRVIWDEQTKKWNVTLGDEKLEREFAPACDDTCYTSCLLRIKLLRGEKLEPWQIYKALHSAIQRRGYDPNIPWKTREQRRSEKPEDDEGKTLTRMQEFEKQLAEMVPNHKEYQWPCYFDAWKMGLWNPNKPEELKLRQDCQAQTTRNQIVPRRLIEKEVRALVDAAAKQIPALEGKADFLLFGPTQRPYASYYADERKKHGLREGGANDWQGVVGQKIPRFDNRIIGKCVLIPRLNVCKIRKDPNGKLHPKSVIAAEAVFLMKLKNMRFQVAHSVRGLTAKEITDIFTDPKRHKLGLTPTQWKKWCRSFGGDPLPGQHEEVAEPNFSGRSRFCRPALEILKRLILSGDTPQQAFDKECARLNGNTNLLKGLVADDLRFLSKMGNTWEGIYIPNQKLDALARSTEDKHEAIRQLISSQNDPIVRHRLSLFTERLDELAEKFGTPDFVVLEFVREDFMGKKAKLEYFKFQRDRAAQRAKAREEAAKAGANEGAAGLKMELLEAQGGICLYTGDTLVPTSLDEYVIDHIVPRAKGGPDSAMNYVLTTRRTNDDKLDRTPYEWLSNTPGWAAYIERVKKRISTLRNKKAQLLTAPDAESLVQKYTALAETAWISKLAQTIIGLRFGWPGGIADGKRRVIVISGGLTGRIRRKYKLNSLLNPDAKDEEEAEKKNRGDDRHHALDAMVISFLPTWARDDRFAGFFRFPDDISRELFKKEIAEVIPQNVCFEKAALAETIYGARNDHGNKIIVQRIELLSLAMKPTAPGKTIFDLKYAVKQAQFVRDQIIRERLQKFLERTPDQASWRKFCAEFYLTRKDGTAGSHVQFVKMNMGEPTEYKDLSKDGTGAYRKALKGHKGQIVYALTSVNKNGKKTETLEVCPIYAFESFATVSAKLKQEFGDSMQVRGVFQSGCMIEVTSQVFHAMKPLPPGKYILNTIITDSGQVKLTTPDGRTYPAIPKYSLRSMIAAGMRRAD
ncbi:MAG: type II CRISPR RNA-guided endonuclease Cas9 [Verrucomicrobiia bacterium]